MLKKYFKIIYPLVVIGLVVGAVMGMTYQLLEPKLADAEKREMETALRRVIPSAASFSAETYGDHPYYKAVGKSGDVIGYAIRLSKKGYGGPVVTLTGITNGAVDSVLVLSADNETPGLGTKAKEPKWLAQFPGLTEDKFPSNRQALKDSGLDAISGATLTTMAVVGNIRDSLTYYAILTNPAAANAGLDNDTGATVRTENKKKKQDR